MQGSQTAADYFAKAGPGRLTLWPTVADSLDRLRASCDLVIAEGRPFAEGLSARIAAMPEIRQAYLGL